MQRSSRRKATAVNVKLCEDGGAARVVSAASLGPLAPRIRRRRAHLADVFLPGGYPHSVAPGYGAYQLWDMAQGLTSYVRANLAYKATLEGLGVGDVEASVMAGALANVAKDASSSLAGLLLAYCSGKDFGRRVRQWRLMADVANDCGLTLQMLAPWYKDHFVFIACLAAACHCACGVMAGATKASISQHFARDGNFEELVSKEGSQEQAVNVLGLLLGYGVLTVLNDSPLTVIGAFVILTVLHVLANVLAVRQLRFRTVNEPRFRVLFDRFQQSLPLDIVSVGDAEPLLFAGRRPLGCSLADVAHVPAATAAAALLAAEGRNFVILEGHALLAPDATTLDALEARFCLAGGRAADWPAFLKALAAAGWDTSTPLLDDAGARVRWRKV
jgi:hypothetical protein